MDLAVLLGCEVSSLLEVMCEITNSPALTSLNKSGGLESKEKTWFWLRCFIAATEVM